MIRECCVKDPDEIKTTGNSRPIIMVDANGLIYHKYGKIEELVEETKCPIRNVQFVLRKEYKSPGTRVQDSKLHEWKDAGWHEQANFSVHGFQFFYDDCGINYTQFPTMQDYSTIHEKLEDWQDKEGKNYSNEVMEIMEKYDEINAKLSPQIDYGKIDDIDIGEINITLKKPILKGSKDDRGNIILYGGKSNSNALF